MEEMEEEINDDIEVDGDDDDEVSLDFAVDDDDASDSGDDDFEIEEPQPKRTAARTRRKKEPSFGGVRRSKLVEPASAKRAWKAMMAEYSDEFATYTIRIKLAQGQGIEHIKFGRGFVIGVIDMNKAEVLFEEGLRKLVFGR